MLEYYIRDTAQKWFVDKIASRVSSFLSPFQITMLALLFGLMVPFFCSFSMPVAAVIVLLISGYLDVLDGSVARLQDAESDLGAAFDILTDRIVEASVVIGLFLIDPASRGLICLGLLFSILICITSFLVVGIFTQNEGYKSFYYSRALMERFEAFAFFVAMLLKPEWFIPLSLVFIVLLFWTAGEHIFRFSRFERVTDE